VCAELDEVASLMKKTEDLSKQIYYYSAAFGALDRAIKTEFDEDLFAASFITQTSYNTLVSQVNLIRGGDLNVPIQKEDVDAIADQISTLSQRIKKGSDVYPALRRIMVLTFAQTGPGRYLAERGRIPRGS